MMYLCVRVSMLVHSTLFLLDCVTVLTEVFFVCQFISPFLFDNHNVRPILLAFSWQQKITTVFIVYKYFKSDVKRHHSIRNERGID